jgi:hypothetical protein
LPPGNLINLPRGASNRTEGENATLTSTDPGRKPSGRKLRDKRQNPENRSGKSKKLKKERNRVNLLGGENGLRPPRIRERPLGGVFVINLRKQQTSGFRINITAIIPKK